MSLFIGLCTFPLGYAFQAYKQINCKLPQNVNDTTVNHIKTAMTPFLNEVGIRKDIRIIENLNLTFCVAQGTNISRQGAAFIALAPKLYALDKDLCTWVTKHEISHIKHNDLLTLCLVPGICQLAASIFSAFYLSFFPAIALTMTVGIVTQSIFSKWREAKADDFAIKYSTDDELKGARRFFLAIDKPTSTLLHPSHASRARKVERALANRNIALDIDKEAEIVNTVVKPFFKSQADEVKQSVKENGGILGLIADMWKL